MERDGARTPFGNMAETYQRVVVPAMFTPEGLGLLGVAALRPGERVLDVACGTGVVARLAAPRLGAGGHITGLDLNAEMLSVARSLAPVPGAPIAWRQGTALALPFTDSTFDAVLCQNGLQFISDRQAALREMRRVLRAGGRLVLSVVGREAASQAVEATVARFLGPDVLAAFQQPCALSDANALASLFEGVGFSEVAILRQSFTGKCPTADAFLSFILDIRLGSVLEQLEPIRYDALMAHARDQLAPYMTAEGLAFPIEMLVVVAQT